MFARYNITRIIRDSEAYGNDCFDEFKTGKCVSVGQAQILAKNWYEVSLEFGKSIACHSAVIVEAMERDRDIGGQNALKNLLPEIHRIAAHDLGLYEGAVDGKRGPFHSDMWVNMCCPLGKWRQVDVFPETKVLTGHIRDSLRISAPKGLAMIRVVEGTALEIPKAMRPFFLAVREHNAPLFSEDTIGYISHHVILEQDHDAVSGGVVDRYVEAFPESAEKFAQEVAVGCALFGLFWKRMRREIYK